VSLGPEHEKHLITGISCISIPPHLPHCPLNIRKVTNPIVFLEISLAEKYKSMDIERPAAKKIVSGSVTRNRFWSGGIFQPKGILGKVFDRKHCLVDGAFTPLEVKSEIPYSNPGQARI